MAPAKKKPTKKRSAAKAVARPVPRKIAVKAKPAPVELQIVEFKQLDLWLRWLEKHHGSSPGIWLKLAKRSSGRESITSAQAVDGALRWGWIDGQGRSFDAHAWLMKFTPRRARSVWSKINRARALALIESGDMRPAGLAEVERAQRDGRWERAYDSPRTATVPADLTAALAKNARARAFFAKLDSANRYAFLWRLMTAKRPETRVRRLDTFVAMLSRGETLHPPRVKSSGR